MEQAVPLLRSLNTFLLSILVYSLFFGMPFSILFVLMIAVHESGHYVAFLIKRIPCSFPYFIPFLGAVIYPGKIERAEDEAFIGYAGPLIGGVGATVLYGVWLATHQAHTILLLVSFFAVIMNLFNLIPIRPLDGGSVVKAIGGWVRYIGLGILLICIVFTKSPIMLFVLIAALGEINMQPVLRFWIGISCQILMSIGVLLFLKMTPFTVLTLTIVMIFSALMNLRYWYVARNQMEIIEEKQPAVSWETRVLWTTLYISLIAGLTYLASIQFPLLQEFFS